jgi:cytochrome c-type biogenesis protein CcsB
MSDANWADLSNQAIGAAGVVYFLALLAHLVEWSALRSVPVTTTATARAAVPAGGPPVADEPGVAAPDESTRFRVEMFGRLALMLTMIACAAHFVALLGRGMAADPHRVPWGNMYEFSSMVSLVAVTVFLALLTRQKVRFLGAFVMAPVVLYLGLAGTVLYANAGPLVPALNSYWIKIHVVAAITASGAFMVSGVATVLYLLKERWERRNPQVSLGPGAAAAVEVGAPPEQLTPPEQRGLMAWLPASEVLDRLAYRVVAFAFPVWTFAIMAGAIWAEQAWSRYWGWDPKETWSFITWLAYAAYLHARATAGWRGRRAAVLSLIGFGCLMVDYYVVNTVITGLHSYVGVS